MAIEVKKYTLEEFDKWNSFIANSINGNFLHSRQFYDSNALNEADDSSLMFFKKNKIIAVLPAMLQQQDQSLILNSHLRATYGGVIINTSVGVSEAIEIIGLIIQYARNFSVTEIIVRNPFRILYKQLSDEVDYALWYHDFSIQSRELEIYVDLKKDITEIRQSYENGAKYNIKKAWKSVTVQASNDLERFWKILSDNLEIKYGKKPVHSYPAIINLQNNVGQHNCKLFGAYYEGNLVAGCYTFLLNDKIIHAQYIGQDDTFQELRPLNAVLDYIIEWGHQNGYETFNLGTANEGGKTINEGLFHFKEGFGGRGVLRETMHLHL